MSQDRELETLSPVDVARLTGLHHQTVLAEITAGALKAKKIRGHYLVTREAYAAWLEPDDAPPPVRPSAVRRARDDGAGTVERLDAIERDASR